jgi:hypothetical protein
VHEKVLKEEATVDTFMALKKWHGDRRNGPRAMMGPGRSWPPPAEAWPTVQEWHGARDMVFGDKARTMLYKEPGKGEY